MGVGMGYSLTIGEAEIDYDAGSTTEGQEFDFGDFWIHVSAKGEKNDDAPAFGEPTDYTNQRWPSYSSWHYFCEYANLFDVFYNDRGSINGGHPGAMPVTKEMQKRINKSYMIIKGKFPNVIASFEKNELSDEEYEANAAMCRLKWLKYWVDWSLENCQQPVFVNS